MLGINDHIVTSKRLGKHVDICKAISEANAQRQLSVIGDLESVSGWQWAWCCGHGRRKGGMRAGSLVAGRACMLRWCWCQDVP